MAVWTITACGLELEKLEAEIEAWLRQHASYKQTPTTVGFAEIRMLELEYIRVHRQTLGFAPGVLPTRQRRKFLAYRQAKKREDTTRVAI